MESVTLRCRCWSKLNIVELLVPSEGFFLKCGLKIQPSARFIGYLYPVDTIREI